MSRLRDKIVEPVEGQDWQNFLRSFENFQLNFAMTAGVAEFELEQFQISLRREKLREIRKEKRKTKEKKKTFKMENREERNKTNEGR